MEAPPHHELLLQIWESLSTERELDCLLAAAANLLTPLVPFEGVAVIQFGGVTGRPFALHTAGTLERPEPPPAARPGIPYKDSDVTRRLHAGQPYTCSDLLEQKAWLPHEFRLAAIGLRAYAAVPLMMRGKLIGLVCFTRAAPQPFSKAEVALLSSVSRPIGVAASNALANEEIRKLRDQLEAENVALRSELGQVRGFDEIVGNSPAMRGVLASADQVASTDATVLITGETGTGKELIARAIHMRSPRARNPLVKLNCAAIPAGLIASELFGHERGAFTGALGHRKGRFEQAQGGTLFLDEVGDLPPETQISLLRVLQEREFERLGGNQTVRLDVRVIAATHRDLSEDVRAGRFRSDLYYRLNVFPIRIPALRERPEDVAPLVAHFAARYAARFARTITLIDKRSLKAMEAHAWPGNVRELENLVERAVIVSRHGKLAVDRDALTEFPAGSLSADLQSREREAIEAALHGSAARISGPNGAAARLGIPPSTLESRIRRLGIDKFRYRRVP